MLSALVLAASSMSAALAESRILDRERACAALSSILALAEEDGARMRGRSGREVPPEGSYASPYWRRARRGLEEACR